MAARIAVHTVIELVGVESLVDSLSRLNIINVKIISCKFQYFNSKIKLLRSKTGIK